MRIYSNKRSEKS